MFYLKGYLLQYLVLIDKGYGVMLVYFIKSFRFNKRSKSQILDIKS